ncbi:MAG: hypothetical protein WCG06_06750, partial [Candidatus Omnitrophota bacterium]
MSGTDDTLELVAGDGSDRPLDFETLAFLKARAQVTVKRAQQFYSSGRADSSAARYCEWQGQTPDGLVTADTDNQEVEPFDGASDQRLRWCDQMANEDVVLLMTALSQAQLNCVPRGRGDADGARRNTLLLRYLIDEMGSDWWLQNWRMASYMVADDPALAAMRVEWRSERRMEYRSVTAKELAGIYVQREVERLAGAGLSVETAQEQLAGAEANFLLQLLDPQAGDGDLTELVLRTFAGLKRPRAARIVREMRKSGVAEFPMEIAPLEGARVRALQFGVDFTFDSATTDWDRCRAWFEPVWMTAPELRAAVAEQG